MLTRPITTFFNMGYSQTCTTTNYMNYIKGTIFGIAFLGLVSINIQCKGDKKEDPAASEMAMPGQAVSITKTDFGTLPGGEKVALFTLKNEAGMEVGIITYGGIITTLKVPDKQGIYKDVVMGFPTLDQYVESNPYFGAIIGRYGNRIAGGKFTLDGEEYILAKNNGPNHLHGGVKGFDKVVWQATEKTDDNSSSLLLSYLSPDGEEGYPGNLQVRVTYTLNQDNSLDMIYEASTDKKTVVNLTNHSYFNLSGDFSRTILDHMLEIEADGYLPVDSGLIPTGEIRPVSGTPFDFREPKEIGQDIQADNEQIRLGKGFDHCWVLNKQDDEMPLAARAHEPNSGRVLEVYTTEPGIQFYSGNFLDGTLPAKNGGTYAQRSGFCLETQHYPDSPNQAGFPSVVLNPGEQYTSRTSFKFSTN